MNFKQIVKIVSLGLLASAFGQTAVAMEIPREELNKQLLEAARISNIENVAQLLERGAYSNCKDKKCGITPLIYASTNNKLEIAKLLLEHGADSNGKDNFDNTPLVWASTISPADDLIWGSTIADKLEMAKLLLEYGADSNYKNKDGDTPLIYASRYNYPAIAKLLLEHGADINHKNNNGETALIFVSRYNNLAIAKLLLEYGADSNCKDNDGDTPLIDASTNNNLDIAKLLLEHGAHIYHTSKCNKTALDYATDYGHTSIIEVINNEIINRKQTLSRRLSTLPHNSSVFSTAAKQVQDNPTLLTSILEQRIGDNNLALVAPLIKCRAHKIPVKKDKKSYCLIS